MNRVRRRRLCLMLAALGSSIASTAAPQAAVRPGADEELEEVLRSFHDAAAKPDGRRLFACLAPDAILFGTDAVERWTVGAFRAFAAPRIARGQGMTSRPTERHIYVAEGGDVAWFDECLRSPVLGELRATGVARKTAGEWKLVQYHWAFPIPNDVFRPLVKRIAERPRQKAPVDVEAMRGQPGTPAGEVKAVLTGLHGAAAEADAERYFAQFADDAICFGTAPEERFTRAELEKHAAPYFEPGVGWMLMPTRQHVYLSADRKVAWFDERLQSPKWGELRATGVLCQRDGKWKITQFHLALPVPDDLVAVLLEMVAERRPGK